MHLTGRTRFRAGWFRRLVLQVQYLVAGPDPGTWTYHWRDARAEDLGELTSLAFAQPPQLVIQTASHGLPGEEPPHARKPH